MRRCPHPTFVNSPLLHSAPPPAECDGRRTLRRGRYVLSTAESCSAAATDGSAGAITLPQLLSGIARFRDRPQPVPEEMEDDVLPPEKAGRGMGAAAGEGAGEGADGGTPAAVVPVAGGGAAPVVSASPRTSMCAVM